MTNIEQIQQPYDWENAPVICELNGSKWILGPEADEEELDWDAAIEWCTSVGGELPPREVLLMCYMNEDIKKEFAATCCWSSTEFTATSAWYQFFTNGSQNYGIKAIATYVRAVRRLDI